MIDKNRLDLFLSRGYFRMQQQVFTCRYVYFNEVRYPVHWLRIVLADVRFGPKQNRLLRINSQYTTIVKPLQLTDELEELYDHYWNNLDFDAPYSVESCLLDGNPRTIFDTYVVEVRDQGRLIAAGIFDQGQRSIAGIMNFYHPAYHKQSLGKYLMLQKMLYAQQQQKVYYYPGYLVGHYPKFDYKLFACQAATEVYDAQTGDWLPFSWETTRALEATFPDAD
ncbi:arginine-tRNA-protein transferase [Fibrella arboris]|uniref:arginine-tRNA-protein transferase n=1 Tax=Fibrella arboris TaxID=3242486 RepID=UPI0035220E77